MLVERGPPVAQRSQSGGGEEGDGGAGAMGGTTLRRVEMLEESVACHP